MDTSDVILDVQDLKVRFPVFGGIIPRIPRLPPVPADFTFISRLQWGFYSVLTMLRARANWYRMLPPRLLPS